MDSFDKCPNCGSELIEKDVEKLLRGGKHTRSVKVRAEVCLHCGERLFTEKQVKFFEQICSNLLKNQTHEYKHISESNLVSPSET